MVVMAATAINPIESRSYGVRDVVRIAYVVSDGGNKFVTKRSAQPGERSTADDVLSVLNPGGGQDAIQRAHAISVEAGELGDELIDEILASAEETRGNGEYRRTLREVARSETVHESSIGLLVSVILAWTRLAERGATRVIRNLPATVVSLEPAKPRFGPSTLITLEAKSGERMLWFRKRPTTLTAGDEVVIESARAKSRGKRGLIITHVALEDRSVLL